MRNPAMKRVEKWLKLSVLPSDRGCGDSRAGAVDADGFTGPRADGCVVSSGTDTSSSRFGMRSSS